MYNFLSFLPRESTFNVALVLGWVSFNFHDGVYVISHGMPYKNICNGQWWQSHCIFNIKYYPILKHKTIALPLLCIRTQ